MYSVRVRKLDQMDDLIDANDAQLQNRKRVKLFSIFFKL